MRIASRTIDSSVALIAALATLPLAACGGSEDRAISVVAIGRPQAPFESGTRLSFAAQQVRAATTEGLVGFDEQGRIVPGVAERWIVTDDGQSYIFRLRDGTWRTGAPITPQAVRARLREALAGLRGTPLGLDLAGIDEIRVMAGRVIEIRLDRPMPNLLQLLAQPELGLRQGEQWTGPMQLTRAGLTATLTPIAPERRGLPAQQDWNGRMRPVRFVALPAERAVEHFNRGEADILLGGRIETFPMARSIGLARGTIQLDPVTGLLGLAVLRGEGFLAAPENREALALAIDRDALIVPFGVSGWMPTTRVVAPGTAGDTFLVAERWAGLSIRERQSKAAARVTRWRDQEGAGRTVRLRIALPQGPGGDTLFARVRTDFQAIGVEAVRAPDEDGADLRLIDAVARYSSATWFLNQFNCRVQRALCSESADALAAAAGRTADVAARAGLLADAEAELTRANVYIPFGAPVRWSLVRGSASGFAPNRWGVHPLMPMARRPR